jgi:hypothetical protein
MVASLQITPKRAPRFSRPDRSKKRAEQRAARQAWLENDLNQSAIK